MYIGSRRKSRQKKFNQFFDKFINETAEIEEKEDEYQRKLYNSKKRAERHKNIRRSVKSKKESPVERKKKDVLVNIEDEKPKTTLLFKRLLRSKKIGIANKEEEEEKEEVRKEYLKETSLNRKEVIRVKKELHSYYKNKYSRKYRAVSVRHKRLQQFLKNQQSTKKNELTQPKKKRIRVNDSYMDLNRSNDLQKMSFNEESEETNKKENRKIFQSKYPLANFDNEGDIPYREGRSGGKKALRTMRRLTPSGDHRKYRQHQLRNASAHTTPLQRSSYNNYALMERARQSRKRNFEYRKRMEKEYDDIPVIQRSFSLAVRKPEGITHVELDDYLLNTSKRYGVILDDKQELLNEKLAKKLHEDLKETRLKQTITKRNGCEKNRKYSHESHSLSTPNSSILLSSSLKKSSSLSIDTLSTYSISTKCERSTSKSSSSSISSSSFSSYSFSTHSSISSSSSSFRSIRSNAQSNSSTLSQSGSYSSKLSYSSLSIGDIPPKTSRNKKTELRRKGKLSTKQILKQKEEKRKSPDPNDTRNKLLDRKENVKQLPLPPNQAERLAKRRKDRIWAMAKVLLKHLFSQIGLSGLVVVYVMLGGFIFDALESGYESKWQQKSRIARAGFITEMMRYTEGLVAERYGMPIRLTLTNYSYVLGTRLNDFLAGDIHYEKSDIMDALLKPIIMPDMSKTNIQATCQQFCSLDSHQQPTINLKNNSRNLFRIQRIRREVTKILKDTVREERQVKSTVISTKKPAVLKDVNDVNDVEDTEIWTFASSMLYSATVITTIGYGNITPKTDWGKIVTIIYALFGIPLMFMCLNNTGDMLADIFTKCYTMFIKCICHLICCHTCRKSGKKKEEMNTITEKISKEQLLKQKDVDDMTELELLQTKLYEIKDSFKNASNWFHISTLPNFIIQPTSIKRPNIDPEKFLTSPPLLKKQISEFANEKFKAISPSLCSVGGLRRQMKNEERKKSKLLNNVENDEDKTTCMTSSQCSQSTTTHVNTPKLLEDQTKSIEKKSRVLKKKLKSMSNSKSLEKQKYQSGTLFLKLSKEHINMSPSLKFLSVPSIGRRDRSFDLQQQSFKSISIHSPTFRSHGKRSKEKIGKENNEKYLATILPLEEETKKKDEKKLEVQSISEMKSSMDENKLTISAITSQQHSSENVESKSVKISTNTTMITLTDKSDKSKEEQQSNKMEKKKYKSKRTPSKHRHRHRRYPHSYDKRRKYESRSHGSKRSRSRNRTKKRRRKGSQRKSEAAKNSHYGYDYYKIMKERQQMDKQPVHVPILASLGILCAYIFSGAVLFGAWENWTLLDGAYFCFITFTSIGFGDMVPGKGSLDGSSAEKAALCSLYLLFGMVIMATCFKLMQDEVLAKVKWLAQKMGIIE
ncbi:hypothetical protein SNEBB_003074 [Seison nebaliae]|nr:hypothetical protein SNEBB_003074 [Seison nebaliae]